MNGFKLKDGRDRDSYILKLVKNIYGLKQAGRVWNQHLQKGLTELGYRKSKIDLFLYYRSGLIMIIYTDDCIMASEKPVTLENAIMELSKKWEITDEGGIDEYLGVKVQHNDDGSFKLSQLLLIEQILTALGSIEHTRPKATTALSSKTKRRRWPRPQDSVRLSENHMTVELPREVVKTWHRICSTPVHQVCSESKDQFQTCNTKNRKVPDEDQKHRTFNVAQQQSTGALVQCWLLWKLESGNCWDWQIYHKIKNSIYLHICRLSNHMVIKNAERNSTEHNGGWIHSP